MSSSHRRGGLFFQKIKEIDKTAATAYSVYIQ